MPIETVPAIVYSVMSAAIVVCAFFLRRVVQRVDDVALSAERQGECISRIQYDVEKIEKKMDRFSSLKEDIQVLKYAVFKNRVACEAENI